MPSEWLMARVASLLGPWELAAVTFSVLPELIDSGLRCAEGWFPYVSVKPRSQFFLPPTSMCQYVEN